MYSWTPFSSLLSRNGSCLPRQDILQFLGLEVDGMDQAAAYCTGRSTPSCAHETANACVWEHSIRSPDDCPFQVSSLWRSRGWVQEEFNPRDPRRLLLVRPETGICRVLQIPSRPRRLLTVSLCSINRDLQRQPSTVNGETLQKRRPKASTDDRPSTRKLLFSFLFDSRALIATQRRIASTTQTAMPCAPRSYLAFGDRDRWPGPRLTRPPPLHLQFSSVLLQLHDRDFSSRVAKECLLNSFASDSFVRKQTSVRESKKKKKKTVDYRIRIPAIG